MCYLKSLFRDKGDTFVSFPKHKTEIAFSFVFKQVLHIAEEVRLKCKLSDNHFEF